MPSEEENRLVRDSGIYQTHELVSGMDGVQRRDFGNQGGLKPQQRVDSMGDDGGGELLQGSEYIENHSGSDSADDRKREHDQPMVLDMPKGSEMSMDPRNRIARQWRCPAFAWKALEAMPVRNLFRVTQPSMEQKPSKDADETFVKTGAGLLSVVKDGGMCSERKLVTIVLAFQRWRHIQLKVSLQKKLHDCKVLTEIVAAHLFRPSSHQTLARNQHDQLDRTNILGQELRKVLEEAREDETALAALETELEQTEQQLANARANSSRLRSQLAAAINKSFHENGYSADNTTVSKSGREMMRYMEGLKEAETEIQRRDNQIQQLKERIRCMEDQSGRVDGQLSRLQAEKSNLQAENSSTLRENRALLEQLSSKDKEVIKHVEEMERLKALAARLVEQQNTKQEHMELIMAEHSAEVKTLQEQLQQACVAKSSKEVELATRVEHCSHLKEEKDTLLLQLQEAEKRADLVSYRAEELCTKLQCTTDDRTKASEEVAKEMVKHLKKLTHHVRELENTVNAADRSHSWPLLADGSHAARYRIENTPGSKHRSSRRSTPELDQVYYTFPQNRVSGFLDSAPSCPTCTGVDAQDQRNVSFTSVSGPKLLEPRSSAHHSFQGKIENWIIWKWRWAASTARAELLARELHGFNHKVPGDSDLDHKQHKVQELMERLRTENLTTCMENELNLMVADHKLVPLILSAWRAFTRTSALERKAISRSALLDKMLEALPWWIRRVSDRRQLQRSFFKWQLLTLSVDRQSNPQQDMRNKFSIKPVVEEPPSYEDSHTPSMAGPSSSMNLQRLVLGHSDENPAVTLQRRQSPKAPTAHANRKRSPGDEGNQLTSGTQTRVLQALQTTLQQEVTELQKILCHEIHPLQQRNTQIKGRPATAPTTHSSSKEPRPDGEVLKSVLGVCNNLALALTNVRGKLNPRVLADTVITFSPNERMKLNRISSTLLLKDARRIQFLEGQSPKNSPRKGLVSGRPILKSRNSKALEGWGSQIVAPSSQNHSCDFYSRKSTSVAHPYERRSDDSIHR